MMTFVCEFFSIRSISLLQNLSEFSAAALALVVMGARFFPGGLGFIDLADGIRFGFFFLCLERAFDIPVIG